jgi:hypothetical protein
MAEFPAIPRAGDAMRDAHLTADLTMQADANP